MSNLSIWPAPVLLDGLGAQLPVAVTDPDVERADRTRVNRSVRGRPVSRRAIVRRLLPPSAPGVPGER